MTSELYLAIDIGTGSVRAALVDRFGTVLHIASREHEQIVPAFGWSEQRPADWWAGVVHVVREAIGFIDGAAARIAAVCACGQNHGTVLIDKAGALTRAAAPLWNDKRTTDLVAAFKAASGRTPTSPKAAIRQRRPGPPSNFNGCATMTGAPTTPPLRC